MRLCPLDKRSAALLKLRHLSENQSAIGVVLVWEGSGDDKAAALGGGVRAENEIVKVANRLRRVEPGGESSSIGKLNTEGKCGLR